MKEDLGHTKLASCSAAWGEVSGISGITAKQQAWSGEKHSRVDDF